MQVLALARPVAVGQVLSDADLKEVLGAEREGLPVVEADRRASVVGRRAATSLPAGTQLVDAMLGGMPAPAGSVVMALALKEGQYPPGTGPGAQVALFEAKPQSEGAGGGAELARGTVLEVVPASGSAAGAVLTVRVPEGRAAAVAAGGQELVAAELPAAAAEGGAG
ncbi:SAF domain-containing protein [Kitasatospora arboriphila]